MTTSLDRISMYLPANYQELAAFAVAVAKSGLYGFKTPESALVAMMTGIDIGLGVVQSLRGVYSVHGRCGFYADTIAALALGHPDCEVWEFAESTDAKATLRSKRRGRPITTVTWTIERAKRAGLIRGGDSAWSTHPAAMLRARCMSEAGRLDYPDRLMGIYTPDELDESEQRGNGSVVPALPAFAAASVEPAVTVADVVATPVAAHEPVKRTRSRAKQERGEYAEGPVAEVPPAEQAPVSAPAEQPDPLLSWIDPLHGLKTVDELRQHDYAAYAAIGGHARWPEYVAASKARRAEILTAAVVP